jgi:hypothetical protein
MKFHRKLLCQLVYDRNPSLKIISKMNDWTDSSLYEVIFYHDETEKYYRTTYRLNEDDPPYEGEGRMIECRQMIPFGIGGFIEAVDGRNYPTCPSSSFCRKHPLLHKK